MSRGMLLLLVAVLLLAGGAVYLSTSAREVPVRPIEVDVSRDSPSS